MWHLTQRRCSTCTLQKRVLKTWEESFIDEDTGETVTIERNEILFDRGTLIDQDILAKIRFSMEADGIREVEVSNQNRLAFENENNVLYPHIAQAEIGGKKKQVSCFTQQGWRMLALSWKTISN